MPLCQWASITPFTKENASHLTGYLEWYTATAIKFPYYQVKLAIHGVGIPEKKPKAEVQFR